MDEQRPSNGRTVVRWVMKMDSEEKLEKDIVYRYGKQYIMLEHLRTKKMLEKDEYDILVKKLKDEYNILDNCVEDKEEI